jgi:hypothetical protein
LVAGTELLVDLTEVEVAVADALYLQGDVFAGGPRGYGGAVFDFIDRCSDQYPPACRQPREAAEQAGELRARPVRAAASASCMSAGTLTFAALCALGSDT